MDIENIYSHAPSLDWIHPISEAQWEGWVYPPALVLAHIWYPDPEINIKKYITHRLKNCDIIKRKDIHNNVLFNILPLTYSRLLICMQYESCFIYISKLYSICKTYILYISYTVMRDKVFNYGPGLRRCFSKLVTLTRRV